MSLLAHLKRAGARPTSPLGLIRAEGGVSAIEFALVAPMLFFSLLAAADVGLAIHDRITLDHVLRAGAQTAMRDAGVAQIQNRMQQVACESYSVADICATELPALTTLGASAYCICPSTGVTDTTCTNSCGVEPNRFYRLSAARTYTPMFLPNMDALDFAPVVLVEVR